VEKVEANSVGSQRRKVWCGRAGESPLIELLDGLSSPMDMDEDESTGVRPTSPFRVDPRLLTDGLPGCSCMGCATSCRHPPFA
jgi:hypothetical protein